jgi:GNAT superfamily N-acetyltransferase
VEPLSDIDVRFARPEEVLDLRHAILRHGLPRETAIFPGDDDPDTRHFAARVDGPGGAIVGCVTLHLNDWKGEPAYQLRGMAVDPSLQRRGVGRVLLEAVEAFVRSPASPTRLLWCNARTPAVPFYGTHGWQVVSDVFDIPSAGPHVKMIKRL